MINLTNVRQDKNIGVCSFEELSQGEPVVLALGMFDGVHAGHRRLFSKTVEMSLEFDASPTVLTFVNHPSEIIYPVKTPLLLNTTREKAMLAADCGIRQMVMLWFDDEFALLEPEDFIEKYILQLNVKGVVCGYNYRFGKKAKGDAEYLKAYLKRYGVQTHVVEQLSIDGISVCSTYIRSLIENGKMESAAKYLSAEYIVGGDVEHGFERGRTLGFPTVNIIPRKEKCLPPNGVYATKTVIDSKEYISVTNVGSNPTYNNAANTVETYIIGFEGDLYGKYVIVEFYGKLRDEIKFSGSFELAEQIDKDKNSTIKYFEEKYV